MDTALLVIDMQNDYFPGGKMELTGSTEAAMKTGAILKHFRNRSIPVIHIQHLSVREGATFFIPGTDGAGIHSSVTPLPDEKIFTKYYPNSFRNTGLQNYLTANGIKKLVVAGMMTHMCVDTTVRAAFDLGYETILAGDCCATRNLTIHGREVAAEHVHDSFLAALNPLFASVMTKDQIIELFI